MAEGVYALERERRATHVNPAAERMLGWARSELLGEVVHDTIHYLSEAHKAATRETALGSIVTIDRHGSILELDAAA